MKKIELIAPEAREPVGLVQQATGHGMGKPDAGPAVVADVPHPPPRSEA